MNMGDHRKESGNPKGPQANSSGPNNHDVGQIYYSTPELTQRLELLRHLTDNSERVTVVKGPEGAGKTTFLNQFASQGREEWNLCIVDANPMLQPDQLFSALIRFYGAQETSEEDIDALVMRFSQIQGEGGVAVIVVDDAHILPIATIIALLRLYERRTDERALVRIVLFAEDQISDQLRTPQIQAMNLQPVQELELPILTPHQCSQFIALKLKQLAPETVASLPEVKLKSICEKSTGLPGDVELKVYELLQQGIPREYPKLKQPLTALLDDLPRAALIGVPALALVLLLTLVFQDEINQYFEAPQGNGLGELSSAEKPSVVPLQLPGVDTEPGAGIEQMPPKQSEKAVVKTLPADSQADTSESTGSVEQKFKFPQVEMPEVQQPAPAKEVPDTISEPEIAEDKSSQKPPVGPEAGLANEPQSKPVVEKELDKAKEQASMTPLAEEEAKKETVVTAKAAQEAVAEEGTPTDQKAEQTKVKAEHVAALAPKPAGVTARTVLKSHDWLKQQKSTDYTLQLIGLGDAQGAIKFIKDKGLIEEAAYFKTLRNGRPWYSVVYGVYPDRDAAIAARDKLPAELSKRESWPRTFASIHKALTP